MNDRLTFAATRGAPVDLIVTLLIGTAAAAVTAGVALNERHPAGDVVERADADARPGRRTASGAVARSVAAACAAVGIGVDIDR